MQNSNNFNVIKCYKILFTIDGIKKNIGFYIILFNIVITIICLILFLIKGYKNLCRKINDIVYFMLNHFKNKKETNKKDKKNKKGKSDIKVGKAKKEKTKKSPKTIEIKGGIINIINIDKKNDNLESINKIIKSKKNLKKNKVVDDRTKDNNNKKIYNSKIEKIKI